MKKIILGAAVAGLLILAITLCTFTVNEKEYVIVTQFGEVKRVLDRAGGPHLKLPGLFQTVNRIDRRIDVFKTQLIQLLLGDKNPVVLTCYVCWRVSDPQLFFESLGNPENARRKLGDMVNSQLGNTLGDYRLESIINTTPGRVKLAEIEEKILKRTNAKTREKYGLEIVQVGIRRLAYPTIVAEAVYNRMRSEREKEAKKYRAEGKEEATVIKAKADRAVTEILAEAYKKAEIRKGEGDQQALKIYSDAYGEDEEFFEFMKSMEVYQNILSKNSTLVLSTDSNLFRYLNDPAGKE